MREYIYTIVCIVNMLFESQFEETDERKPVAKGHYVQLHTRSNQGQEEGECIVHYLHA